MNFHNIRALKDTADLRLSSAREEKKLVLIYGGIVIGLAVLVTLLSHVLDLRIAQSGGLSNMGSRTILSSIQSVLPMVQSVVLLCLEIGYIAAMLRISRGQYVSTQTLRLGFDRIWVLIRVTLLQSLIYTGVSVAAFYLSANIFAVTPLSSDFMDIVLPMMEGTTMLNPATLMLDEATVLQLLKSMIPLFVITGIIFAVLAIPVFYQYRMVNYVIIDKPALGAMAALRESRKIMRRNGFALFRVDLSLWYYYLAGAAAVVIGYGDWILASLGISLPLSETAASLVFYGFLLAAQFAVYYFLRNRAEVIYGLVYEDLRPKEESDGVVLGNIFQM